MTHSLWDLGRGQTATIGGFDEELPESYCNRLTELGFYPGERVTCLQAPALGAPRVYRVANSTFSLDDDIARFLLLRPADSQSS
ncbi:MAG: FeoA family protein [Pseudomonadota bacterium]